MIDEVDKAKLSEHRQRQKMLNAVWAVYERRFNVAYSQDRPSQLLSHWLPVRLAAKRITKSDCSGLVGIGCDWADIRIHGRKVDWRYVNTWVLLSLFRQEVHLSRAEPGDLVFYGPYPSNPTHMAIFKGDGEIITNGHYPMQVKDIDYRNDRIHIRSLI